MDIWSKEKRSDVMSKIRSSNTKPEKLLRSLLHREGLRFRIHRQDLPGKPDIVFSKQKIAIFVHGCFWHYHKDCREGRIPSTNTKFWKTKLQKNVERDIRNLKTMRKLKWLAIEIWECDIEKRPWKPVKRITQALKKRSYV